MLVKTVRPFLLFLLLAAAVSALSGASSVADVEPVETLDGTRVYHLTVHFMQPLPADAAIEYLILSADGTIAGGGQFSVRPDMVAPEGDAVSMLTGFGGLDMSRGYRIVAEVTRAIPERTRKALTESQITDTCTTFCDRCSDKAVAVCTNGVSTYNCGCSGESRTCNYSCFGGGKPPV